MGQVTWVIFHSRQIVQNQFLAFYPPSHIWIILKDLGGVKRSLARCVVGFNAPRTPFWG